MFILKHGLREKLPYVKEIRIGATGFDLSYTDKPELGFYLASRAVAIGVARALQSYGNFYAVEVSECLK
ncbi:hypothetical protein [Streptococcus suis]|uniref:hypothetical protein n=1 Tax=Streptococcus suis TaxID=1307 RepID=UPI001ABEB5A8|nr:hypothetical protein [Streptococcus suis]